MPVDLTEPRPQISANVLKLLRDRYGLILSAEPKDLGGSFSLNIRVDTSADRYVARVHGTQTEPARLASIQHARRHLAAGGVPSPEPVLTREGKSFVLVAGHLMEVERFVEHDAEMDIWTRLELGLPHLGRTHSLLQSFPVGAAGRRAPIANHIEPDEALSGTLRGVARMRAWDPTDEELALAASFEELAHLVAEAERDSVSKLPRQLVMHSGRWSLCAISGGGEKHLPRPCSGETLRGRCRKSDSRHRRTLPLQ